MTTLMEYERVFKGKCGFCDASLDFEPIEFYEHDGGWQVEGFAQRQWLYVTCPKCGYQWSLTKLGIREKEEESLLDVEQERLHAMEDEAPRGMDGRTIFPVKAVE